MPIRLRVIPALILVTLFATVANAASVIVELSGEPAAMAAARAKKDGHPWSAAQVENYRSRLAGSQAKFLDALRAQNIPFTIGGVSVNNVRIDFAYTLVFNGINLEVADAAIPLIQAMPQVKKVHANDMLHTSLDVSVPYIRAPQVYGAIKEVTRFDHANEGYEGQGVYLSVIDSGIEWHHEMFGGDPTPPRLGVAPATASGTNEKVVYYLPLADVVVEDGLGHGTHVASTAAGYQGFAPGADGLPNTADDIRMHGVAPQARIMSYKVCSDAGSIAGQAAPVGGCLSAAITMAIEDSVSPRTVNGLPKPVAQVINMSLGGSGGPDSVTAIAADNAVRLGCSVVAAGGNSGPGEGTVGAPCTGRLVTCVGNSIDPAGSWSTDVLAPSAVNRLLPGGVTPAANLPAASGQRSGMQLIPMSGATEPPKAGVAQYYVYVAGGETPASYPASVAGRIALVKTSLPSTFAQIANSAALAGAVAVFNRTDTANPTAVKATIPAANLPVADFDYLVSLMGAGASPASGTLSTYPIRINSFYGNTLMNSSSSRGPVEGYGQVKPDVTAPGTNILAAMPPASLLGVLAQGNYGSISGTSMASPHVAGATALVRQAHPTWNPDMVRTALGNSSTNLRNESGAAKADGTTAESIIDQGSGLIDVQHAVNIKALMGVTSTDLNLPSILGSHSFGEVPAIGSRGVVSRSVVVTIRDLSGTAGSYALSVANNRGLELSGVSVTASPSTVAVAANGSATFTVTASIDGSVVTSGAPLQLQWYVRAARQDGAESLVMPFYLRATQTFPSAASLAPIADDATPDQQAGVDRDGRYTINWSYPASDPARPCGYRVEETRPAAAGTIWFDDAEETLVDSNSKWVAADWTSRPHAGTTTMGYGALYIDNDSATLTMATDVSLPRALVTLTFDAFQDTEPDFDYAYVDISTDHGAGWTQLARYTGNFTGQRSIDLSAFAGSDVRLRFRLVSDDNLSAPAYQGWSVDNIRIQAGAAFETLATVGGTSYAVSGKPDGAYAYRITALFGNCASNPFATLPSNIEQITVQNATAPPTASFTGAPNSSDIGQTVTFDAAASHDNDSVNGGSPGIAQYWWSFGDGTTASGRTVTHAYSASGTYRVSLTVIDDDGESASAESEQEVTTLQAGP